MDVYSTVKKIICEIAELEAEQFDDTTNFKEIEGAEYDSLRALDILTALEEEFKIRLPEEVLPKLSNLKSTVEEIERRLDKVAVS